MHTTARSVVRRRPWDLVQVSAYIRLREARRARLGKQFGQLRPGVHLVFVTVRHAETNEVAHASIVLCECNRSATRECLFEPPEKEKYRCFLPWPMRVYHR
jgi:hypothetical protein